MVETVQSGVDSRHIGMMEEGDPVPLRTLLSRFSRMANEALKQQIAFDMTEDG